MKFKVGFLIDPNNNWIEKSIKKRFSKNTKKYIYLVSKNKKRFFNFDILFILGYTRFLSSNFLRKNSLNLVVHESDLPKGRGLAPVQWQLLKNKKRLPIKLFKVNQKIDTGDIYEHDYFFIKKSDLDNEIRFKQALATIKIIENFLRKYPRVKSSKQKGKASYFKKRNPKDHKLDVNKSLKANFNLLRILIMKNILLISIYTEKSILLRFSKVNKILSKKI